MAANRKDRPDADAGTLADALTFFGFTPTDVESFRACSHDDPLWDFNNQVLQSATSVYSDWKEDAASVLMDVAQRLRAFDVCTDFGKAKGHLTVEISHGGEVAFYTLSAKKPGSLTGLIFALDAVLPGHVEIYAHQLLDGSDMAGHTALSKESWGRVRELLGSDFDRLFSKATPRVTFAKGAAPKSARIDWKKRYAWGKPRDVRVDEYVTQEYARQRKRWDDFAGQGTTPKRGKVSPARLFEERRLRLLDDGLGPWLLHGDSSNLATALFQMSMLALLGSEWDLFQWKGTGNPRKELTGVLGYGSLIWAYFAFAALGAATEAKRAGDLLLEPNVGNKERHPLHTRQDSWYDFAAFLHAGRQGKALLILADLLDLQERAGWQEPAKVERALKCHAVTSGEQYVHENDRWCWPAPLYALARRAGAIDLLPRDNPFLATPVDVSAVNFDDPLLVFLRAQHDEFARLDRTHFPGLIGVTQAQYDQIVQQARKGKKGEVVSCRCDAEYLVRKIPQDTRITGKIPCQICGESFLAWEGPVDYEVELLIANAAAH